MFSSPLSIFSFLPFLLPLMRHAPFPSTPPPIYFFSGFFFRTATYPAAFRSSVRGLVFFSFGDFLVLFSICCFLSRRSRRSDSSRSFLFRRSFAFCRTCKKNKLTKRIDSYKNSRCLAYLDRMIFFFSAEFRFFLLFFDRLVLRSLVFGFYFWFLFVFVLFLGLARGWT